MGLLDSIFGSVVGGAVDGAVSGATGGATPTAEPTKKSFFDGLFSDNKATNASFITAGIQATGTLVAGLFANEVAKDEQERLIAEAEANREFQAAENEKNRGVSMASIASAERGRILAAKLASIQQRAATGMAANDGYSRQANVLQNTGKTGQESINSLISAQGLLR